MTTTTTTLLEQLAQEVLALRSELASLREQLATEVRTRRLVVEHESGFESIVAEARSETAQVKVAARTDPDTWTSIHANEEDGDVFTGLHLSGGGNGRGMFTVYQHGDDGKGAFPGDFDPDSLTYSASLDIVEDRGRVALSVDGLEVRSG